MKILVLEDDQERIIQFVERFTEAGIPSEDVHFAVDVKPAIDLLAIHTFDVLFLDHDLDQRRMVGIDELNTGSEFARQLKEMKESGQIEEIPMSFIHSYNPWGAENMQRILGRKSERVPSIWTQSFKPVYKRLKEDSLLVE